MSSFLIGKIDLSNKDLNNDISYLNNLPKIDEEYDEFAQGYWKNISLINASGQGEDTQYRECEEAFPTPHLERCPEVQKIINENFSLANLKMVRARNLIDGMVIPHRDFVEMDGQPSRFFRVFMMLESNDQAYHSDESGVFQMKKGEVWFLDAAIDHTAINFSTSSRMGLCLDFIFEENTFQPADIFSSDSKYFTQEPTFLTRQPLGQLEKNHIIGGIAALISRHTFKDMLFVVSKYHFKYDIAVSECYDWLITAAEHKNESLLVEKAKNLKGYLIEQRDLGQRFSIAD